MKSSTLRRSGRSSNTYSSSNVANISDTYNGTGAELLSFAFTHADNDQVYKDVTATITEKGDSILVNAEVPVIGKRLRPSFILSGQPVQTQPNQTASQYI